MWVDWEVQFRFTKPWKPLNPNPNLHQQQQEFHGRWIPTMKALRTLRRTLYSPTPATVFRAFFSAQPQPHHDDPTDSSVFDSSHYALEAEPTLKPEPKPTWDEKYRARADRVVFGEEGPKGKLRVKEEEDERRRRALAKALLEAAMDEGEDEEEEGKGAGLVKEDDQKSLSVGIIGAPNAGKSALTNYMVRSN